MIEIDTLGTLTMIVLVCLDGLCSLLCQLLSLHCRVCQKF